MMAPDLWSAVWLLVDQYTWVVVILVLLMLSFLGTVIACALMALARPEDDQVRHQTKPNSPDNWRRSGSNWHGKL